MTSDAATAAPAPVQSERRRTPLRDLSGRPAGAVLARNLPANNGDRVGVAAFSSSI